jgi:hypothetical protein
MKRTDCIPNGLTQLRKQFWRGTILRTLLSPDQLADGMTYIHAMHHAKDKRSDGQPTNVEKLTGLSREPRDSLVSNDRYRKRARNIQL